MSGDAPRDLQVAAEIEERRAIAGDDPSRTEGVPIFWELDDRVFSEIDSFAKLALKEKREAEEFQKKFGHRYEFGLGLASGFAIAASCLAIRFGLAQWDFDAPGDLGKRRAA